MNGCVIPHTPIAVDFWKIRECPQARIFFLTHLHGDHVTGLTSSWNYPIYCSEVTGKLLVQRYGVKEELIHSLQTECAEIIYLDAERSEQMTVTAIDANHCPGAVMFLMEGYFGTILHTGDFRYHSDMICEPQSVLSKCAGKVDVLYLDNTYCSPDCVFPTRAEATSKIIDIIGQHPDYDVLIAMRNLGKEDLLCKIAMHFHEWISVPAKFYKTLEILGAPDVFDNSSFDHRIRVVPFHKVSNKFVDHVNEEQQTIVILPTALYHGIEATPFEKNDKVFVVPYSDHSSFTELRNFVSYIRPKKVIPVVKSNSRGPFGLSIADRADMAVFADVVSGDWTYKIETPVSVQAFMHCKNHKLLGLEKKGLKRKANLKVSQAKKIKRGVTYDSPKSVSKTHCRSSDEIPQDTLVASGNKKEKESHNKVGGSDTLSVKRALFDLDPNTDLIKCDQGKNTTGSRGNEQLKKEKPLPLDKIGSACKKPKVKVRYKEYRFSGNVAKAKAKEVAEKYKLSRGHNRLQRRQEAKAESQANGKGAVEVQNRKKESSVSNNENGNVALRKEKTDIYHKIPELNEKYFQILKKKTAMKMPLQFVSEQDSRFDAAVGMKTYSKSCKSPRVNKTAVENEKLMKMNGTAQWLLENFEQRMDVVSRAETGSIEVNGGEDEDIWKYNHENVCENESRQETSKERIKTNLKQSVLSKYFTAGNEESALADEQGINISRKLNHCKSLYKNQCDKGTSNYQKDIKEDVGGNQENLEESESDEGRLIIITDTEPLDAINGNKESERCQFRHTEVDDSMETADNGFENKNISGESVIAQVGTQAQDVNDSLKCINLIEKKSLSRNHLDGKVTDIVDEKIHESEFGEEHNVSDESVIPQIGTQVQNSTVHSKSIKLMKKKSLGINHSKSVVTNIVEKKSTEMEHVNELRDEHNTSNESVTAQAGTQMNRDLRFNDLVRNNTEAMNKTYETDISMIDIDEVQSPEVENKHESSDNSLAILIGENTEQSAATRLNIGSNKCANVQNVQKASPELSSDNFQNELEKLKTGKSGTKHRKREAFIAKGNASENPEELKDDVDADVSVFVNVGTQIDVRESERNDDTTVDDDRNIITCVGKDTSSKVSRKSRLSDECKKYKICCKQCELDAFRQAFEKFEKLNLKEESNSLQKGKKLKQKACRTGLQSTENSRGFMCTFKVKPVHR